MIRALAAALCAALCGFAEMTLELVAVRSFAPHFGDSAPVWTNVIGVMLAAMALGAFVGGRLALPERSRGRLAGLLLAAAVVAALVPLLIGPVGRWLVPADLPLDRAMGALVGGSLTATLLLFAPPVLLAGAVTPLLVTALTAGGTAVGRASGLVATWSIVGGLCGTFATTHLLVPGVGSRATIWIAAGCLLAAAVVVRAGRGAAVAALGVLAAAGLGPRGPLRAPGDGETMIEERESAYQYLQVVDRREEGQQARLLRINEGLDSFHSVRIEGSPWTGGRYYDWHVVAPWLAGDGARPADLRVLSLGAAAGTFERLFGALHPGVRFDSVELDPMVVELGRRDFGGFGAAAGVHAGVDARVFVEHASVRWHVVLVDAYERQIYVPAHVASVEFFTAVQGCLEDGGVVSVNVGGLSFEDPVVRTIAATMAEVFGAAWALRVPESRNFVVVARKRLPVEPEVLEAVRPVTDATLAHVLEIAREPARWRRFAPGSAPALTDDRPFLDALQERAYGGRDGAAPVAIAGAGDAAAVADAVLAAARSADWDRALDLVQQAPAETAWLRLIAGDARWRRGDYLGARAEYRRASALAGDGELAAASAGRLAEVEGPALGAERADAAGSRNAWLALLGVAWLAACAALAVVGGRRAA
ncbi:MAG: fused MFS/spermidine synthase [Planctomycetes bacterium]|nr:fused MFS/spermidine synthase [Planctomycetota bacterium]